MPHRVPSALTYLVVLAVLALAGCGSGTRPAASVPRPAAPAPPPDPHARLSLPAAEQLIRSHGYSALVWQKAKLGIHQPLKAIVALRDEAADVPGQRAFFFYGNRFVGADTPDVSAEVQVVGNSGDRITLAYVLYKPHDILPIPRGGTARVTFRWDGRGVVPETPVPSSVWGAALSRR
jgi:LppP/LprE lipoprotein